MNFKFEFQCSVILKIKKQFGQYRNENQDFISNFAFQFIKKTKRNGTLGTRILSYQSVLKDLSIHAQPDPKSTQ